MNYRTAAIFAAVLLVAACGEANDRDAAETAKPNPAVAIHALFDEHFERELGMRPLLATEIGDPRYNDRLANRNSPEYIAAAIAFNQEFLDRLQIIDRDELGDQDRLSYDIFKIRREVSLEKYNFPSHLQPVSQFRSLTSTFAQLGSGSSTHPFKTVKDYDDFLARADDFAVAIDQIIVNMKSGMQEGVTRPRILIEKLIPQLEAQRVDDIQDSDFYTPIRDLPREFSDEDRERLIAAYEDKISNTILPAYARLNNFLGDEYVAAARETVGLYAQPNGVEWYEFMVRFRTTTDMTPAQIHQIGLDEVARIQEEMRGVMADVGFEGDLSDFFDFVNTDDRFFYDDAEELIQGYRDMSERIAELADGLFDVKPKSAFEVRRVEPFREASAAKGSYQAGTPDGSRPGIFYANAYDIKARGKWAMESLFLHEAIPGHHFQIMLQQENESLPGFRRFEGFTAYTEGWGLYAESLGKELGVYVDPYQHFGGLNAELWRSIRLVVDTGIHAMKWSRQDVLEYMHANSAVAEVRAVAEAERFMAIPGQALAYKVGQLKIREIRNNAEARLGDRFDVREFHTQVLKDGSMPLSMLETKIDRWVESLL